MLGSWFNVGGRQSDDVDDDVVVVDVFNFKPMWEEGERLRCNIRLCHVGEESDRLRCNIRLCHVFEGKIMVGSNWSIWPVCLIHFRQFETFYV